jgi:RecB family exonuclease
VRLALDWLATERRRHDFEVIAVEREMQVAFGGVEVRAKLDRIDRLHDGRHAVIDYKTGVAMIGAWLGERPDEPQLPMYALSTPEKIDAVAFARVRPGEMEFCGLAKEEGLLPNVRTIQKNKSREAKKYATWEVLREGWARELEALGHAFATGAARVDPKNDEATCRQCDQQVLCRVAEKSPQIEAGVLGDEMEDD